MYTRYINIYIYIYIIYNIKILFFLILILPKIQKNSAINFQECLHRYQVILLLNYVLGLEYKFQ